LICDVDLDVSIKYGAAENASAGSSARIAVLVEKEEDFGTAFVVKEVWMQVDARAFPAELNASL
jgi:hypothetical protein